MHASPIALLLLALLSQEPVTKPGQVFPAQGKPAEKPGPIVVPPTDPNDDVLDRTELEEEYFNTADYDEDGYISFREGEEALSMTRTSFIQYDADEDGLIDREEFGARYNELLDRTGGFPKPKPQGPAPKLGEDPLPIDPHNIEVYLEGVVVPEPAVTPESFVNQYDTNVDGRLSALEIADASAALGYAGVPGQTIINLIDADRSGYAEPGELAEVLSALGLLTANTGTIEMPMAGSVEELFGHAEPRDTAAGAIPQPPLIVGPVFPFRRLDLDDDGALEVEDLRSLSVSSHPRVSPPAVIATLDLDGDGVISPEEFAAAFDG